MSSESHVIVRHNSELDETHVSVRHNSELNETHVIMRHNSESDETCYWCVIKVNPTKHMLLCRVRQNISQ